MILIISPTNKLKRALKRKGYETRSKKYDRNLHTRCLTKEINLLVCDVPGKTRKCLLPYRPLVLKAVRLGIPVLCITDYRDLMFQPDCFIPSSCAITVLFRPIAKDLLSQEVRHLLHHDAVKCKQGGCPRPQ